MATDSESVHLPLVYPALETYTGRIACAGQVVAVGESNHTFLTYEASVVTRPLHRECLGRESNPHAYQAPLFESGVSTIPPPRLGRAVLRQIPRTI